jgi:hypothetical protein
MECLPSHLLHLYLASGGEPCRQGPEPKVRTRGQQRSCISILGRTAIGCRQGRGLHDWCYLELADLEVEEFYSANHGL